MTQPLSQCTVDYDQQRGCCLHKRRVHAGGLRLHSAVWMLKVYEGGTLRGTLMYLTKHHCWIEVNKDSLFFCVESCIFSHDLGVFNFLSHSLAERTAEFWEGWARGVLLYYLWPLRGVLDSSNTDCIFWLDITDCPLCPETDEARPCQHSYVQV